MRLARFTLICLLTAAVSFALGRVSSGWLSGNRQPPPYEHTILVPRAQLPQAALAYPTGQPRSDSRDPLPPEVAGSERWMAVVDRILPACAIVGNGSGVCINPRGDILTNAHVALHPNRQVYVQFPDGGRVVAKVFAINHKLDLALVGIQSDHTFPYAPIAAHAAKGNTKVICIGNPSQYHPTGEPSDYHPFHISLGRIIWHAPEPQDGTFDRAAGGEGMGRTQHDAWTYWGHSGSPLLNKRGEIVALHNAWEANHGTRHAVPLEAIHQFLKDADVPYETAPQ